MAPIDLINEKSSADLLVQNNNHISTSNDNTDISNNIQSMSLIVESNHNSISNKLGDKSDVQQQELNEQNDAEQIRISQNGDEHHNKNDAQDGSQNDSNNQNDLTIAFNKHSSHNQSFKSTLPSVEHNHNKSPNSNLLLIANNNNSNNSNGNKSKNQITNSDPNNAELSNKSNYIYSSSSSSFQTNVSNNTNYDSIKMNELVVRNDNSNGDCITNKSNHDSSTSNSHTESTNEEDVDIFSSSSPSSSSISPVSDQTNKSRINEPSHDMTSTSDVEQSNRQLLELHSEESVNDSSLTPTPTSLNANMPQFTEFVAPNDVTNSKPPNSLALRTNLNRHYSTTPPPPSTTTTTATAPAASTTTVTKSPSPSPCPSPSTYNSSHSQQPQQQQTYAHVYNTTTTTPLIHTNHPHHLNPHASHHHHHHHHHLLHQQYPTPILYSSIAATLPTQHTSAAPHIINYQLPYANYNPLAATSPQPISTESPILASNVIFIHVDADNIFQMQIGDEVKKIIGPATIKLVNNNNDTKPVPLQFTTTPAPGQSVLQLCDENGVLTHLIISSAQQQQQQIQTSSLPTSQATASTSNPIFYQIPSSQSNANFTQYLTSVPNTFYPLDTTYQPAQQLQPQTVPYQHKTSSRKSSRHQINKSPLSNSECLNEDNNNNNCSFLDNNTLVHLNKSLSPSSSSSYSSSISTKSNTKSPQHTSLSSTPNVNLISEDNYPNLNHNQQQQPQKYSSKANRYNKQKFPQSKSFSQTTSTHNSNTIYNHYQHAKSQQKQSPSYNTNTSYNQMEHSTTPSATNQRTANRKQQAAEDPEYEAKFVMYKSLLSTLKQPIVSDIEARSVLVRLTPIDLDCKLADNTKTTCSPSSSTDNLTYTLELSNELNSYFNKVYTGDANEITLKDLKPNTLYYLRVSASINEQFHSDYSTPVSFQTLSCQPDQPVGPKLIGTKKKNELTLRWQNPNDNGSKIINYILEYQQVNDTNVQTLNEDLFSQIYKGILKQFVVKKLTASTCYAFRLAAENGFGLSEYSKPVFFYTSGSVPNQPTDLHLAEATVSSLTLSWNVTATNLSISDDVNYELQMCEDLSQSFQTVFNGSQQQYTVDDLRRCTTYQFRLRARNEEGNSVWSDVKKFKTLANKPNPPCKLKLKSTQNQLKVSWEAPIDNGGSEILRYYVQIAEHKEPLVFETHYEDLKYEYVIDAASKLKPGSRYLLRVYCSNTIGHSDHSETLPFTTLSVCPDKPLAPKLHSKPKANTAHIKWAYPENLDGGSPITFYELKLNGKIVYKGSELGYILTDLCPGRLYEVQLRAANKIGVGQWSDSFEFTSGSDVPDAPDAPTISAKSHNCLLVSWSAPMDNGSAINEYCLEWSHINVTSFTHLFTGNSLKYEVKGGFLPSEKYFFRVQAINVNGSSAPSQYTEFTTPASVPSTVTNIKIEEIGYDFIRIKWKRPNENGSSILHYNLEYGDSSQSNFSNSTIVYCKDTSDSCEYKLNNLQANTFYKLRIQAANSVGVGSFSNSVKIKTKCLPPVAPHLELVSANFNSIKVKWTQLSSNDMETIYFLEYKPNQDEDDNEFLLAYEGSLNACKVTKLNESTSYTFRICAQNESGKGQWSSHHTYSTTKSPPTLSKPPVIKEVTTNSCLVEWQPPKCSSLNNQDESLEYCLQLQTVKKDLEYTDVYRGESCSFKLTNLHPNTEYNCRLSAIRIISPSSEQNRIHSPFTVPVSFTTQKLVAKSKPENDIPTLTNRKADQKSNSIEQKPENKKKNVSILSRFMWPAFYSNINAKTSSSSLTSINQLKSKQARTNKKTDQRQQFYNETYTDALIEDAKPSFNDQKWALLIILFLVAIAFVIAFAFNSMYASLN